MFNLGLMYENGDGIKVDLLESEKWFKKSAEKGYGDATKALERVRQKMLSL